MKKNLVIVFLLLIIGSGLILASGIYLRDKPSQTVINYSDQLYLIIEDEEISGEEAVLIDNSIIYLSLGTVDYYIDNDIFYDELENTLIISSGEKVVRYKLNESLASINSKEILINNTIKEFNNKIYLPIDIILSNYDLNINYFEETNAVVIDFENIEYLKGDIILEGGAIRTDIDIKSPIVASNLELGTVVFVYAEYDSWYRVRTLDGIPGFIDKKYIKINYTKDMFRVEKAREFNRPSNLINLTWDYTYGPVRNTDNIQSIKGINIVSPTWFSLNNHDTSIYDKGNKSYVEKYNNLGYDLWPLLDNDFNPDLTHELLSSSSKREKIINSLLSIYKEYGFQGINIDFENVHLKTRDLFTQFVRELYPLFKEEGIYVSLDITAISTSENWSMFYDRERLAETVDYMILMAYDQHWAASPIAGSVAQYSWVEKSILGVLDYIPNEKLVLALPFYSRLWLEEEDKITSQALTMEVANRFIRENEIELSWDLQSMQYYGEIEKDNIFYRIWLEDAKSLETKVSLVHKYGLAGIASWRKGFETQDIWGSLDRALN